MSLRVLTSQPALERQDLSCMYLADHELESLATFLLLILFLPLLLLLLLLLLFFCYHYDYHLLLLGCRCLSVACTCAGRWRGCMRRCWVLMNGTPACCPWRCTWRRASPSSATFATRAMPRWWSCQSSPAMPSCHLPMPRALSPPSRLPSSAEVAYYITECIVPLLGCFALSISAVS